MIIEWIWSRRKNDRSKFSGSIILAGCDLVVQPFPHCVGMVKVESASEFKSYTESLRKKKKESVKKEGAMDGTSSSARKGKKKESAISEPDPDPKTDATPTFQAKHRPSAIGVNLALYEQYTSMQPFENVGADKVHYHYHTHVNITRLYCFTGVARQGTDVPKLGQCSNVLDHIRDSEVRV